MEMIIPTRRFTLRDYRPADREQFVAYQTDPAFTLFHDESELGEDNANEVFHLFLAWQQQAPRRNYQLAIAMRDNDTNLIGSCGVRMDGCAPGEAVFGIELARPYWGRYRYAEEVSTALIGWAFTELKLSALIADTAFDNAAVSRLAKAMGFVRTHAEDKQWWRMDLATWERKRIDSV
jgi:[ribosomal protein S5]-alanine N-acetyltransferase